MNRKIKIAIKYLLYYSPHFLHDKIKSIQTKREIEEGVKRFKRTRVSKENFSALLDSLDLDSDVFLHTSMVNVGKIQGGTRFIVNKVLESVDVSAHTLIISALPFRGAFKEYLDKDPVFDVRTADIAMGAVNESLARIPGAIRSVHPTHSVVAIGPDASAYTGKHHFDITPFGVHSPYHRIITCRGKILLLGATLNNLTFIHAIEDMVGDVYPLDPYLSKVYEVDCIDASGRHITVKTRCHNPLKGIIRDAQFMHDALLDVGAMRSYALGESELLVLDAMGFTIFYLDLLLSGRSIYGKHKVTDGLREKIRELKRNLNVKS